MRAKIRQLVFWEKDFALLVVRLAVPMIIQSIVMALMHIVDNMMIGQMGELQLAGVTQANRVSFLYNLTMFGVLGGASAFAAQYWGKRDMEGIHQVQGLALLVALLIAAGYALPSILIPERVLGLLLEDADAIACGAEYLRIVAIGYFISSITVIYSTIQKSTEQVTLPMVGSIVAICTNTALNYLLIFGNLGFPEMGVRGAALATLVGMVLELVLVVGLGYAFHFASAASFRQMRLRTRSFVKKYCKVALPIMFNEGLWALGIMMYSVVYGKMGTGAVAAVSIFNNIEQLAAVVLRGMSHACSVIVGMRIGAGREQDAQRDAARTLLAAIVFGQLSGLCMLGLSGPIVSIFNVEAATRESALLMVRYYAGFIGLHAINMLMIVGIMRAGGDVTWSMVLDVGSVWLVSVPLVWLAGLQWGWPIAAVYVISQAEQVVKGGIGLWRFRTRKWIHNLVQDTAPPQQSAEEGNP